jgi:hypothetical protein
MKKSKILPLLVQEQQDLPPRFYCAPRIIDVTFLKKLSVYSCWCWLLLQPAGLAVFEHLGILSDTLKLGAIVTGLEGQLPNKRFGE